MQLTKYKLGDLIVQRREKNNNYDVPIRGVSKDGFIRAKQQEADTSIYNVFYKYDFVFNPARMELNSIALNLEYEKALCSSLYEVFYVKDENIVLPEFLNLHIKRDEFARHCDYIGLGSAREYCRFANISEFDIELPPIEVQQEIVEADRQIKRRIHLNNQVIQHLEATAQALYRKTFVDNIDKENLPEGWRMGTIGKILKKYIRGPFGSALKKEDMQTSGFPVYEQQHVIDEHRNFRYYVSISKYEQLKRFSVQRNDLVISCSGTIGRIIQIRDNDPIGIINQALLILRVDEQKFSPTILRHFLLSKNGHKMLLEDAHGSAQVNIAKRDVIESIPIIVPDLEVIKYSDGEFNTIDHCIELRKQENKKLIELQSLLLAKMGQ